MRTSIAYRSLSLSGIYNIYARHHCSRLRFQIYAYESQNVYRLRQSVYLKYAQFIQELDHPQRFGNTGCTAHGDFYFKGFDNFITGRTGVQCFLCLSQDAIGASGPERDGKGDQAFGFAAECTFFIGLVEHRGFSRHKVGGNFLKFPQKCYPLIV